MDILKTLLSTAIAGVATATMIKGAYIPVYNHLKEKTEQIEKAVDTEQEYIKDIEKEVGWDDETGTDTPAEANTKTVSDLLEGERK